MKSYVNRRPPPGTFLDVFGVSAAVGKNLETMARGFAYFLAIVDWLNHWLLNWPVRITPPLPSARHVYLLGCESVRSFPRSDAEARSEEHGGFWGFFEEQRTGEIAPMHHF